MIILFPLGKKIILEHSFICPIQFGAFCQMHQDIYVCIYTHIDIYVQKALFLNDLISSDRKIYAFAEPIVFQQGAIEHAYNLIACLFTSVS